MNKDSIRHYVDLCVYMRKYELLWLVLVDKLSVTKMKEVNKAFMKNCTDKDVKEWKKEFEHLYELFYKKKVCDK